MPSKTGNCGVSIIDLLLLKLDGLIVPAYFIRPLFFGCRVSEAFSKHFFWTQRSVFFFFFSEHLRDGLVMARSVE